MTIYKEVECDISEFSDNDLIEEIVSRLDSHWFKAMLMDELDINASTDANSICINGKCIPIRNLAFKIKVEEFLEQNLADNV